MSSLAEQAPFPAVESRRAAFFSVAGEPSPGLMPRVLELFAKRGLVPDELHGRAAGGALVIEIRADGMDEALADYIGRCLRQIHSVERVLVGVEASGRA